MKTTLLQTKWSIFFHSHMKTTLLQTNWSIFFHSHMKTNLLQTNWSIFFHSHMKTTLAAFNKLAGSISKEWDINFGDFENPLILLNFCVKTS